MQADADLRENWDTSRSGRGEPLRPHDEGEAENLSGITDKKHGVLLTQPAAVTRCVLEQPHRAGLLNCILQRRFEHESTPCFLSVMAVEVSRPFALVVRT